MPPPQVFRLLAKNPLPISVLVRVDSVQKVVLEKQDERRNPELAMREVAEIFASQS